MPGPLPGPTGNTTSPPPYSSGGGWQQHASGFAGLLYDIFTAKQRRKLEREARQWNLDQWHRVNKYNHPTEQMARLTEAGLNPNLIYGSSPGSAVGNAGAVAPGQAPKFSLNNPMIPFMDARVKQAQSNNMTADTMLKGTQSLKTAVESGMKGRELDLLNAKFDDMVGMTASQAISAEIDAMVKRQTRYSVIMQAFDKNAKDTLAIRLLEGEATNVASGQVKGYTLSNFANLLGYDLSTQSGRESMSIASHLVAGSKIFSVFSGGLKSIVSAGKNLFGNVAKHTRKFYRKRY